MAEDRRYCENCGREIGQTTNFCPNCGAGQRADATAHETDEARMGYAPSIPPVPPTRSRGWGRIAAIGCGGVAILALLVVACSVIVGTQSGNKTASTSSSKGDTTKASTPPTPSKNATGQVEGAIGQPIDLNNRILTVNEAEQNYQTGQRFPQPEAGNQFVRVNFTIENTRSSGTISLNPFEFKVEDSSGVQKPYTPVTQIPNLISASNLAPGGSTTGNLIFQAPQGDSSLRLIYTPISPGSSGASVSL